MLGNWGKFHSLFGLQECGGEDVRIRRGNSDRRGGGGG